MYFLTLFWLPFQLKATPLTGVIPIGPASPPGPYDFPSLTEAFTFVNTFMELNY